jgi:diketogulonate reductase-like aldo/keto reductase
VQDFNAEHGILTQAWSPIGGITFYRDGSHGSTLADPVIGDIATTHGKTPAQVMLRWGLQHGRSVIPKSTNLRSRDPGSPESRRQATREQTYASRDIRSCSEPP